MPRILLVDDDAEHGEWPVARCLGEPRGLHVDCVYAGGMQRQRHTAEITCEVMARKGAQVPDVITDERWNEFSLISVYRAIAQHMIEESPEFERDYREMQAAIRNRAVRCCRGSRMDGRGLRCLQRRVLEGLS